MEQQIFSTKNHYVGYKNGAWKQGTMEDLKGFNLVEVDSFSYENELDAALDVISSLIKEDTQTILGNKYEGLLIHTIYDIADYLENNFDEFSIYQNGKEFYVVGELLNEETKFQIYNVDNESVEDLSITSNHLSDVESYSLFSLV